WSRAGKQIVKSLAFARRLRRASDMARFSSRRPRGTPTASPAAPAARRRQAVVIYLSTQIYGQATGDDGKPVQGARRRDPPPDPRAAAHRRGLRLRHAREPQDSAAEGLPPPGVPAAGGPGRDPARRPLGSLSP